LTEKKKEGKLYKRLREGILEAQKMGGGVMCNSDFILDECAKEFPVLLFPTEIIEFWRMIIAQAKIPELTQQQKRELLMTMLDLIEWFQKWFSGTEKP
jgi:hypothetical protein